MWDDVYDALCRWLESRIARAASVTRFEHGGRELRRVVNRNVTCCCHVCTWEPTPTPGLWENVYDEEGV